MSPSGQTRSTCSEDDIDTEAGEKMCLRGKKRRIPQCCLIRSRLALTLLTRLVFVIVTLFSAAVITTSIWLMLDCRDKFFQLRPLLPDNSNFCTNMGMPALFACCIVLFTIFGLGCTGRRLTGYALIIISSVQMFQSLTTLTFYKCTTLERHDVDVAVNTSILSCHKPPSDADTYKIFIAPFTEISLPSQSSSNAPSRRSLKRKSRHSVLLTEKRRSDKEHVFRSLSDRNSRVRRDTMSLARHHNIRHAHSRRHNRRYKQPVNTVPSAVPSSSHSMADTNNAQEKLNTKILSLDYLSTYSNDIQCSHSSPYFAELSSTSKTEANQCIEVCTAYKNICKARPGGRFHYSEEVPDDESIAAHAQNARARDQGRVGGRNERAMDAASTTLTSIRNQLKHMFDTEVNTCGDYVYESVNSLCYYDNQIIMPLSLCGPMFYIALSACFIYLTYCDRRLKEDAPSTIVIHVPKDSPEKSWTWHILSWCRGNEFTHKSVLFRCRTSRCNNAGNLWDDISPYSRSNSTHELLQLNAIPSSATQGSKMSSAVSQCTLNTCVAEDSSPVMNRHSNT